MKYLILSVALAFASCHTLKKVESDDSFVTIKGERIQLVADEYGNMYMKQQTKCGVVYIPFTFPTEEEEIPRVYETKNILKQIN